MKVFISENDMPQSCSYDCVCYDHEFGCCNIQDDNGNYAHPKTLKDCPHLNSIEKHDKEVAKSVAKEIFGELIKSTALCEPQGGHCSLDYLIVKARQRGLEYVGLDKDGNVIWVGDTITME